MAERAVPHQAETPVPADLVDRGRDAFARRRWADACDHLSAAARHGSLEPGDLERLATAACLAGRADASAEGWARAHHEHLARGEVERAARCAFWLAHGLHEQGEHARAGAWVARARGQLDDRGSDCVERGYLLLPVALQRLDAGDAPGAVDTLRQAAELGRRFDDPDLVALARHAWGRALIRLGARPEGVRLLDEAMVAVDAGDLSPVVVGEVYCSVISGCLEVFDVRRAQEWTTALTRWCEAQPDLVLYRGQCLVRRAEILLLRGAWPEAEEAARQACAHCLDGPDQGAAGAALYQRAELHRVHGRLDDAETAYREASRRGRAPQPGLALLCLAAGRVEAAAAAIRGPLEQAGEQRSRSRLLPAFVEIMLGAGDVAAARGAADELRAIAEDLDAPYLRAVAASADGAVLLAERDASAALPALRRAWTTWQALDAPYEAARIRVLLGLAARELGDPAGAELELDAARWTFEQLGAAHDLARVHALARRAGPRAAGGLTPRETQVLRLVAAGKTNRAIAAELVISEKTVARHVSNIFNKLGLSTRSAATAYAFQQGVV